MNITRLHHVVFLSPVFLALVFLLFSLIPVVQADDNYMGEMSVAWDRYDDGDYESDTYRVDAQIHFSAVDTGEFPRKEAAFLNHIGSVTVSGYENRYGLTGIGYGDSEGEGQGQFLSVVAMKPGFPVMLHAACCRQVIRR
ncbi:MAG: hypothetical protein OEZ10_12145 [Gammaproteobacteria bacterium]|nr:hypothetical protein [Gammaproteobacteria bacterium]